MQTTTSPIIHTFPNIAPINTVEDGIRTGHYTDHYRHITNETVPLIAVEKPKTLSLVCFGRTIGETDYVALLKELDKQPCRNAPNYLLGLMTTTPEDKMPEELRNKYLIAAEPTKSSVFTGKFGPRCFLCVSRRGAGRELHLVYVGGFWGDHWAFVAEDLVP